MNYYFIQQVNFVVQNNLKYLGEEFWKLMALIAGAQSECLLIKLRGATSYYTISCK